MTVPDISFGTPSTRAGNTIGTLTDIGKMDVKRKMLDVTSHQSTARYQEYIGGLLDGGSVPLKGFFQPSDTNGQIGMKTDLEAGTLQAFVITLPAAFATTWTFTGIVEEFGIGDEPVEGAIPFETSIKVTGQPVLAIGASTGLTTPFFTCSVGTLIPAAATAVYSYVDECVTGTASITITPTAAAGVITITANGVSQVVTSGVPSTAIALGSAGSITVATISVQETNKVAKVYTVNIARA